MKKTRKFAHKLGFQDETDHIEVDEDKTVYTISKNGLKLKSPISLRDCLDFVKRGDWIEI